MNRGLVDLRELRRNILKADFYGDTAYCFVRGNKIIKVYAKQGDKGSFTYLNPRTICDFSMYKADTIVFPDEYILENGFKAAEIADYIKNKSLYDMFHEENAEIIIDPFISGYEKVINDFMTYYNILMNDLCSVNILYSNELGYHVIDTTPWKLVDDAHKTNIKRLNEVLIRALIDYFKIPVICGKYYNEIDDNYYDNLSKYGNAGIRLQENMKLLMNDKYRFLDFVFSYMAVYRVHYSEEAKTIDELKEFTKILKKG